MASKAMAGKRSASRTAAATSAKEKVSSSLSSAGFVANAIGIGGLNRDDSDQKERREIDDAAKRATTRMKAICRDFATRQGLSDQTIFSIRSHLQSLDLRG